MTEYLNEASPDAWVDYPPLSEREDTFKKLRPKEWQMATICQRCQGHGGWNLSLNSYPLPSGMENTQENRHKYSHFRSSCFHCTGWGYVTDQRDKDCLHTFDDGVNVGRCLTNYTCTKCGKVRTVDSSD